MTVTSTLDRLASELPMEERKGLLEKLKSQSNISSEPLYEVQGEGAAAALEEQYAKLPWYYHLYYFFLSLFRNKTPLKIFEDTQVTRLGREIETAFPGLYDYQQGNLQGEFYQLLLSLKDAARFFFDALDLSIGRDRGAFYVFLGSLEMGQTHECLQIETDPKTIAQKFSDMSETEIRQASLRAMEDAFAAIKEDERDAMYRNARSLYCLRELSSFLFDRVLMAFGPADAEHGPEAGRTCSVFVVQDMLGSLNNILFSLRDPPPLTLLESLFIFILQERSVEPGFDTDQEIQRLLHQAEKAVIIIRNFNRRIPLTGILRCGSRDMSLSPKTITGGEDWFAVYRDYWKRRIEEQLAAYQLSSRRQGILNSFRVFFKGAELKLPDNAASGTNPEGFPLREDFALAFLRTFHAHIFMGEMNRFLKPIMDKGKFFKPETRDKFIAGYHELIKIEDEIRGLEGRIAPSGEYGKRYIMAQQDMTSLAVKQRKIRMASDEASAEAAKIISRVRGAAAVMISILKGILKKEPKGKNEFLVNLANFTGEGSTFFEDITGAIRQFERVLQLLDDIDLMESGSS